MKVVLDREESPKERLDRAHIEEFQGIKLQPNTANLDESYIYFIGHAKLDLHLTETLTRMRFSETLEPSPGDTA